MSEDIVIQEVKESINSVGERLLMSTPLKNLEAKQEGKIELPMGNLRREM